MSQNAFKVNISPLMAFDLLKKNEDAELVYDDMKDLGDGRYIGTLIYEKYFMRVKNRAALVVIVDNIKGFTDVRAISTGSSQGLIFNFDWGASDDFIYSVQEILEEYIINE